ELLREPGIDAAPVVNDPARLPVQQGSRRTDLAPERLDDRLVTEAHTERRHSPSELDDQLHRAARAGRPARTRRDDEAIRRECVRLLDRHRVAPANDDVGTELLEQVNEVV